VRFRTPGRNAGVVVQALAERGVLVFDTGPDAIRAVTHLMIRPSDIKDALRISVEVMRES
jgi:acetylornithine/succinyldiaminopimelate/putrescine aminotransferase